MDQTSALADCVRINDVLNWSVDRPNSLVEAVAIIRERMRAWLAPAFLLDETGTRLLLVTDDEQSRYLASLGFDSMPAVRFVRAPWVNEDEWPVSAADHVGTEAWETLPAGFRAWWGTSGIVAPVHADGRHLGAVLLAFDRPYRMTDEEAAFLAAAGRILGSAAYRWHHAGREHELGVLEERRRLADELHVDLAQQVAALGLQVEALRLDALNAQHSGHLVDDVATVARSVDILMRGLRHQMVGMRADTELVDEPLGVAVAKHVDICREQLGLPAELVIDDRPAIDEIPLTVAAQLVRVLREALSNIQRHAHASFLEVRLSAARTRVRLEVRDNGRGFDPGTLPDARLGLRIMRERMEQIDGTLTIEAVAGRGTVVIAEAPLRVHGHGVEVTDVA